MLKMRSEMISNVGSTNSESVAVSDREVLAGPIRGNGVANMGPLGRMESKTSFHKRTADAIESMAQTMNETGTATISLLQEQLEISKEDKVRKAEILKNTKQSHEIDMRRKALSELDFYVTIALYRMRCSFRGPSLYMEMGNKKSDSYVLHARRKIVALLS
jgi:hypothetical protein